MRLVEVEWIDSVSHCDKPWHSRQELSDGLDTLTCWTAGYLFHENDEHLTVTLSWGEGEDGEVGMALTIPRRCIVSVRDLQHVHMPTLA